MKANKQVKASRADERSFFMFVVFSTSISRKRVLCSQGTSGFETKIGSETRAAEERVTLVNHGSGSNCCLTF